MPKQSTEFPCSSGIMELFLSSGVSAIGKHDIAFRISTAWRVRRKNKVRSLRLSLMMVLFVAALAGPAYSVELSPEERQARNLEILKSAQYYELMDGLDRMITDGLGFNEAAFEKLNDLFRALKKQDPERFEFIEKSYPEVFKNLDVE